MRDLASRISRPAWLAAGVAVAMIAAASPASAQFLESDVTVIRTHSSADASESFGWVAETIGDINGDGAPEYVVTAPFGNNGGTLRGRVVLYDGATGAQIHEVVGNDGEQLGRGACGPGDVNGDGVADYAVSGTGTNGLPGPQPGRLLVLSGADNSVILDVAGPVDRSFFGYDINGAGDVDGDGHADLIVGAPLDSTGGFFAGAAYVISGADGSILWSFLGIYPGGLVGTGVSGVDDLDGDGRPEQVAAGIGAGKQQLGEAYVLSAVDGSIVATLKPKQDGWNFGSFFVHNAGDTNGDGVGDIYVGDYGNLATGALTGHGYIWSGADLEDRRTIDGEHAGDGFGIGRGVGDVDGDGHADLFIAGFQNSDGAAQGGKGYVYSGRNSKLIRTMTGTVAGVQLGFDAIGLGDVNGDGLVDFMLTGVGVAHVIAGNPAN